MLLDGNSIIAIGEPSQIGEVTDAQITQIDGTVTPSFVNAHTHLDLCGQGICNERHQFVDWVQSIVMPIRAQSELHTINEAVSIGAALSYAGGCATVGDIAGSLEAAAAFAHSGLLGQSFVEIFGTGLRQDAAIARMNALPLGVGVQPHAPYSCSEQVYAAAFAQELPISTHLAETPEEIECVMEGRGPLASFAKEIGAWDDSVGLYSAHPIDAVCSIATAPFIAAHCNYIDHRHLQLLKKANASVVYCPRASAFFGHAQHQWNAMLDCGINVALGTDSLLCLDTPDRLSVLDDMRLLYKNGGDAIRLFEMATVNGAAALNIDKQQFLLSKGTHAGLLLFKEHKGGSIDAILASEEVPSFIIPPPTAK